jgi:cellulose synthase/poly-beta-1,6-N-acetylglucosamine synthase-like glycosyltransferase
MENGLHNFIYILSALAQILVFVFGMEYFIISVWGWIKRKEDNGRVFEPEKTFALVVAAHNEERVVSQVIQSLQSLNYPRELYDIFVVADNCTDNTAAIAREQGALVYERFNKVKRGKGYALEWIFDIIFKHEKHYDAIAIFDADNVVSPNFLTEMNKQFCKGHKAVQGYIDTKNPYDSWITCSYAITYWTMNRLFQLSRYYIGLSGALAGTGFCVATDTIKELGWGATCLTEDLEFTMKLVMNNIKVAWCHDAIVYDEKPLTLKQSWVQRKRWMQGHTDCAFRFIPKLLKKGITEKDIIALDCALYLFQPVNIVLIGLVTLITSIVDYYPTGTFFEMSKLVPFHLWSIFIIAQFLYGPIIVALDKKFSFKMLLGFLVYPIFTLTWIPITVQGALNKNNKDWNHTLHTRQISIKEIEEA